MDLSIGIVSVYFGELPECFSVWLESCRNNPTVDFILLTDHPVNSQTVNVRIIDTTMEEVRRRATVALGFDVSLNTPFKMCDYKPAYGLIFQDLLVNYDYWGYCDIDMIFGDLRHFFKLYHLEQYDKFLPLGHLSLYRNTFENNRRFMNKVDGLSNYIDIFKSNKNYLFDELAVARIFEKHGSYFDKIIFADIWPGRKRYTMCTKLKYYPSIYQELKERYNPVNYCHQIFLWMDGGIYQYYLSVGKIDRREFIYIHIPKRKWKLEGSFSNNMIISDNCVCPIGSELRDIPRVIARYNPYHPMVDVIDDLRGFLRHCWSYFKRKVIKTQFDQIVVEKSS